MLKKLKKITIILVLVTSGCASLFSSKTPTIKFAPPNILDSMQTGYKFDINVGIYSINTEELFLFGSIGEIENYPLQSVLLRSEDGGKHWIEVLLPQQASRVLEFQMEQTGVGWALILQINEGIGESSLFQTVDFGITWTKISEIPRNNNLGFPTFMFFGSEKEGQIDITYPYETPQKGYIAHLSTYDGGETWEETTRFYPDFEDIESQSNITYAYWLYKKNYAISTSIDNKSQWKLEEHENKLYIKRRLPSPVNDSTGHIMWAEWEIVNTIPITLYYKNGVIESP